MGVVTGVKWGGGDLLSMKELELEAAGILAVSLLHVFPAGGLDSFITLQTAKSEWQK